MTHPYTGELNYMTKDILLGIASDRSSEDKPKAFAKSILQYEHWYEFCVAKDLTEVLSYMPKPDYLYNRLEAEYLFFDGDES